jgi:hypothetical protein
MGKRRADELEDGDAAAKVSKLIMRIQHSALTHARVRPARPLRSLE